VDDEVIRDLYCRAYDDEVSGGRRLEFMGLYRLTAAEPADQGARLSLYSLATEQSLDLPVDLVVCATGYHHMAAADLLAGLDAYCLRDGDGGYVVERDYRVLTSPALRCGIYLQGATECSHGLSSSLLSNLATRGGDIADSIIEHTPHRTDEKGARREQQPVRQ
jgi:L-ornithine N5-oxygenase